MDKSKLFDQKIRDAINNYEVPFDDSAWSNIESKINVQPKGKVIQWKTWAISAAAAAALVIGYFIVNPSTNAPVEHVENKKTEVVKPSDKKTSTVIDDSKVDDSITEDSNNSEIEGTENEKNHSIESLPLIEDEQTITDKLEVEDAKDEQLITDSEIEGSIENSDDDGQEVELLALSIHINKEVLCQYEAVSFTMSECNIPVELSWNFGDGQIAEGSSVNHIYNEAGVYQIQMIARSVLDEEIVSTENYSIKVNPKPEADFEMIKSENMAAYPEVTFKSINDQFSSLEWKINDETIQNSTVVEKMFRNKGAYTIGLVVKNQFQCTDTLYQHLVINNNFNLLAPNAFSPNGDGINDTFMPQAIPYLNQGFTLQVFAPKTGQMIFESNDFTIPWNGNIMNNGNKMADGAYAWSVKTEDGSVYKGTILITTK